MQTVLKEHTEPQFHQQQVCYNKQLHQELVAHPLEDEYHSLRSEIQLYTRRHKGHLNRTGRTASRGNQGSSKYSYRKEK